ncbi:hypothetical protein ACU610_21335 [Geodermatophilus sp. URMC 61]|uniref:hypothetical protein n=1 Tax=Geodermatophilus sp. URMC 61 TaxID=3423411 RepID=UPI00406C1F9C
MGSNVMVPNQEPRRPPSGQLGEVARSAAVGAALPLVATYFVGGTTFSLTGAPRVATQSGLLGADVVSADRVVAAIRLRVALVAGSKLAQIVRNVAVTPNFRYRRASEDHVGQLRGRLDVVRYLRERGRVTVPRRYPVHVIQRDSATPENVLVAFTLRWMLRELDAATGLISPPPGSAEARDVAALRSDLLRLHGLPLVQDAVSAADRVRGRESLGGLLERVEARLAAGHVGRPAAYTELTQWVTESLAGEPVVQPGEVAAAFYGEEFDTRLFELWCLAKLAEALTEVLGDPIEASTDFSQRDQRPVFVFAAGESRAEVYFQASLKALTGADALWVYEPGDRPLAGIPDLAVRCVRAGKSVSVLLDAKLRQRKGPPSEEIYKVLGYFANMPTSAGPERLGGIVFHDPAGFRAVDTRRYTLRQGTVGLLEAVGVDPADDPGSREAFSVLAALVMRASRRLSESS